MLRRFAPIFGAVLLALSMLAPTAAHAQFWQCVGYAREVSGVDIHGNAKTWWNQADGRYQRGKAPKVGAVLAFRGAPGMRLGHVAVVSRIVGDREILLNHANWSRRGRVEHDVRAIDVSDAGDWSRVRVWYGPTGDLGTRVNPTFGFIYPGSTPTPIDDAPAPAFARAHHDRGPLLSADVIQMAMLER